jgi:hypothetical protein
MDVFVCVCVDIEEGREKNQENKKSIKTEKIKNFKM